MDYLQSFAISSAGMAAERTRVEVAALNLANANSVGDAAGIYRPLRAVVHAGSAEAGHAASFGSLVGHGLGGPTVTIDAIDRAPRRVLDPGHPQADAAGFVSYPAIDTATEMVSMMSATRAYEANVAAMNSARTVALKTLDIGN
jgi:flagellar basal-body rod protein FlgC